MGKRTATIAVLLALTFLGSLLALAVVGGVRTIRVSPALGPADPLLPALEGPPVDAPEDPGPSRASSPPDLRPTPSEDAVVPPAGSPPAPSAESVIEPEDQVAVDPPPGQPPAVTPPPVQPPAVVPPELPVTPVLGNSEEDDGSTIGSVAQNGSGGEGHLQGKREGEDQTSQEER
jgi:hypothetical protein